MRNRVQSCRTHVAEVLKDTGEVFIRKLLSFRNALRRLCQLFLVDRAKAAVDCVFAPADSSATSVRLIIDRFVSLYILYLFLPFIFPFISPPFPSSLLFFFFYFERTKNRFCKKREEGRGEKKRQGEQREKERRVFALSNELLRYFRLAESAGLKWNLG